MSDWSKYQGCCVCKAMPGSPCVVWQWYDLDILGLYTKRRYNPALVEKAGPHVLRRTATGVKYEGHIVDGH